MAHPIPVSATVQSGQAPLDDLRLDLFMVTRDGTIAKAVGSFPVAAGVTDFTPQTVSMTSIALAPEGAEVGCRVVLTAGALTGGIVFEPFPPLVAGA